MKHRISVSIACAAMLVVAQQASAARACAETTAQDTPRSLQASAVRAASLSTRPVAKNVIIMVSDGTGYNHIAASDLYELGPGGTQAYERFALRAAMSTYSASGRGYDPAQAWSSFEYLKRYPTDSAAAATAMSTGLKTYNGAIGVTGSPNSPVRARHLMERAEDIGMATGVVTTVQWSHGTPAGFSAHNVSRSNYAQIANEMVFRSRLDVIMGAGNPWYDENARRLASPWSYRYVGGSTTWKSLRAGTAGGDANGDGRSDRWTVIQSLAQFQALRSGSTPRRVLGTARVHTTLNEERGGNKSAGPYTVARNTGVPSLSEMSSGALNVLDNDPDGFVLMIEGGAVDWASHKHRTGRMIEEHLEFDRAVEAVCAWVDAESNWDETLLIVTADHETGYLQGPGSGTVGGVPVWNPLGFKGVGVQPGVQWNLEEHSNSLVPVFVKGRSVRSISRWADQRDARRGPYLDNTELSRMALTAMGR